MKTTDKFFIAVFVLMLVWYAGIKPNIKPHGRVLELPEEIHNPQLNDTLKVYKITADTIYIGFANKRNN